MSHINMDAGHGLEGEKPKGSYAGGKDRISDWDETKYYYF
jgi:hypothetical protein